MILRVTNLVKQNAQINRNLNKTIQAKLLVLMERYK